MLFNLFHAEKLKKKEKASKLGVANSANNSAADRPTGWPLFSGRPGPGPGWPGRPGWSGELYYSLNWGNILQKKIILHHNTGWGIVATAHLP